MYLEIRCRPSVRHPFYVWKVIVQKSPAGNIIGNQALRSYNEVKQYCIQEGYMRCIGESFDF